MAENYRASSEPFGWKEGLARAREKLKEERSREKTVRARANRCRGKRVQRECARRQGAENVGLLGGEDGRSSRFSEEYKGRARSPLVQWMRQAEANAGEGKIPLLRIHIHNQRYSDDFVVVRAKHWCKLLEVGR